MGVRDTYYPLVISFLVVDGIAVSLRLWARRLKRAIGYDDIVMWLSFVRSNLSTLVTILTIYRSVLLYSVQWSSKQYGTASGQRRWNLTSTRSKLLWYCLVVFLKSQFTNVLVVLYHLPDRLHPHYRNLEAWRRTRPSPTRKRRRYENRPNNPHHVHDHRDTLVSGHYIDLWPPVPSAICCLESRRGFMSVDICAGNDWSGSIWNGCDHQLVLCGIET